MLKVYTTVTGAQYVWNVLCVSSSCISRFSLTHKLFLLLTNVTGTTCNFCICVCMPDCVREITVRSCWDLLPGQSCVCLYFLTVLHLLQRWKQQHAQWYTFTSKYGNMHRVIILKLQSENANHILEQYNNRNKLSTKQNKKYKHETDEYLHELCLEFDSEESCKVYFQSLSGSVKWTAVGKAAKPSGSF